jgi:hypothetical protein
MPGFGGDEDAAEFFDVIAFAAFDADLDGEALAALDGGADVLAADGDFHGIQHILGAESVARHGEAIHLDVEIGFALHA